LNAKRAGATEPQLAGPQHGLVCVGRRHHQIENPAGSGIASKSQPEQLQRRQQVCWHEANEAGLVNRQDQVMLDFLAVYSATQKDGYWESAEIQSGDATKIRSSSSATMCTRTGTAMAISNLVMVGSSEVTD
jgi:hypothetical protein